MERWELESRIKYLEGLNEGSIDRPEVIENRKVHIKHLKKLLINKVEEQYEIRNKQIPTD